MEEGAATISDVLEVWITTLERNDRLAMIISEEMVARLPTLVCRFNSNIGPMYERITNDHNMATYSLPAAVDVVVAVS